MRKWTDNDIETQVRGIAAALGHFPSNSELRDLKRQDLANQISKHGGFIEWAQRVQINRLPSDSDTGWEGEDAARNKLVQIGFSVSSRDGVKCPFDLLIDNILRVDVKAARLCHYSNIRGWFYRIGKHPQADLILLWQLDTGDFYALPWFICPTSNVTISVSGGKYAPYRNNTLIVREMLAIRINEREHIGRN